MTLDEFAILTTQEKWNHIEKVMGYISQMDKAYDLRRRLNPHHPPEDKKKEERAIRLDQFQRWTHVKDLYAANRDELSNTFEDEGFQECKSILERIFTQEVDDALREMMDD